MSIYRLISLDITKRSRAYIILNIPLIPISTPIFAVSCISASKMLSLAAISGGSSLDKRGVLLISEEIYGVDTEYIYHIKLNLTADLCNAVIVT